MPHQCTDCGRNFEDGSKEMLSGCPNCGGNKFQYLPESAAESQPEPTPVDQPTVEESSSSVARKVGSAATAVRDLVGSSSPPERPDSPTTTEPELRTDQSPEPDGPGESSSPERPVESREPERTRRDSSQPERAQTDSRRAQRDSQKPRSSGQSQTAQASTGRPSHSPESTTDTGTSSGRQPSDELEPASMRTAESENSAQANARSEVISPDELPPSPEPSGWDRATSGPRANTRQSTVSTEPEESSDGTTHSGAAEQTNPDQRTDRPDLDELRAELNQQFESIKVVEPGQYELNLMELFDRQEYIVALQEDGKYTVQVPEHWQE